MGLLCWSQRPFLFYTREKSPPCIPSISHCPARPYWLPLTQHKAPTAIHHIQQLQLWTPHSCNHISTGSTKERSGRSSLRPSKARSYPSRSGLSHHSLTPTNTPVKEKRPANSGTFHICNTALKNRPCMRNNSYDIPMLQKR